MVFIIVLIYFFKRAIDPCEAGATRLRGELLGQQQQGQAEEARGVEENETGPVHSHGFEFRSTVWGSDPS